MLLHADVFHSFDQRVGLIEVKSSGGLPGCVERRRPNCLYFSNIWYVCLAFQGVEEEDSLLFEYIVGEGEDEEEVAPRRR